MEQTATTLTFDRALPGAERPAHRQHRLISMPDLEDERSLDRAAPEPPPAPTAAELEQRTHDAAQSYTGRILWTVALFIAGGALLTSVDRVTPFIGTLALSCLLAAVVVQYLGRRRLREALIARAVAKGVPTRTARSNAEATLDRIAR
ncbi:MAG: hypothetical protein R3B70_33745 [Polyangiaceae bacterium]